MLSKYSVLALLGSASAAAGPLPKDTNNANFPKFSDTTGLDPADKTSGGVNAAYVTTGTTEAGEIKGYRNDLYAIIQQKVKITTAANLTAAYNADGTEAFTLQAQDASYSTFYSADKTKRGNKAIVKPGTVADKAAYAGSYLAQGATWNVCEGLTTTTICNGGLAVHAITVATNDGTGTYRYIPGRVIIKLGQTAKYQVGAGGANELGEIQTFNSDILMASFYQSSGTATDGTTWCTAWSVPTLKDGKETAAGVSQGWDATTKCTFQFVSDDKTYYPSVKMTNADSLDFFLQFQEWLQAANLGTNGQLPNADDTTYQIGKLDPAGGKVYLNPATALGTDGASWKAMSASTFLTINNPEDYWPGSFGTVGWYPGKEGPSKLTQVITADSSIILDRFSFVSTVFNDYSSKKTTYDGLRTTYNDAAQKESDRIKDFFKAMFEPPVTVPTRPCAPTQPADYSGVTIDLADSLKEGLQTQDKQGMIAALNMRDKIYTKEARFHSRIGYLLSAADASKTGAITNVGHVWGRFGEGDATLWANNSPFFYGESATDDLPGLQISVFPNKILTTALASGKKIDFTAISKTAASNDMYKVASRPGAAEEPSTVLTGAKALLATGLAAATVIATIA